MIPYQIIDVAGPVDILSCCSKPFLSKLEKAHYPGTEGITAKAIDIDFHHINETMDPVTLTAAMTVLPTTTCDNCPPLDILLVGGPDPVNYHLPQRFAEFIRAHLEAGNLLFTTCTGASSIALSGVLDGKNATINHGFLELAEKLYPKVNWVKKQWVVDGNIWTAGGACAGMDMVAHWVIENYGMDLAKFGFYMLDYEPRDINGDRVLPSQHSAVGA